MEITGRSIFEGVPKTITVDDQEIRESLSDCIIQIVGAIRLVLERTPPELSADLAERGIVLTGGGALIKKLDMCIREETGLPVLVEVDPFDSVTLGFAQLLKSSDWKQLERASEYHR